MFFNRKVDFYSLNLDEYITQVRKGDLRYLPLIFCVFSENSDKHKWIASRVLKEILNKLALDDIYRVDKQMRETTSMEWSIDWRSLNAKNFVTNTYYLSEDGMKILVLALFALTYLLCFGLLLGATLGGNLTPIGASANITALGILRKAGHEVKSTQFMKISIPFTLTAVTVGYIMVWFLWR